jgi:hypothetical protein
MPLDPAGDGHSRLRAKPSALQSCACPRRVAFAFDTKRKAILLVADDKSGVSEKRFYRELIRKADDRFDAHLARLKSKGK